MRFIFWTENFSHFPILKLEHPKGRKIFLDDLVMEIVCKFDVDMNQKSFFPKANNVVKLDESIFMKSRRRISFGDRDSKLKWRWKVKRKFKQKKQKFDWSLSWYSASSRDTWISNEIVALIHFWTFDWIFDFLKKVFD